MRLSIKGYIKDFQEDCEENLEKSPKYNKRRSLMKNELFLKKCQGAVKFLKEQTALIGTCVGMYEILYLIFLTYALTSTTFVLLSSILRGEHITFTEMIFVSGSRVCIQLARLYFKCHLAENITKEVW